MATKNTTKSQDNDLFFDILIGILCIIPFIAGFFAWLITIPFCKYLANRKLYWFEFNQTHKKPKDRYSAPLIIFSAINGGLLGGSIAMTCVLSLQNGWFVTSNPSYLTMSILSIFFWMTLVFELIGAIVIWFKQLKFKPEELDIIVLKEKKSVAERLEKPGIFESIWYALTHQKLMQKELEKVEKIIISNKLDNSNDVVLNAKDQVIIPADALKTGTLILGATGTGKTNTILHFIKQAVKSNKLIVFVNGKQDESLKNQLANLAEENGYQLLHWNLDNKEVNFSYNILKGKTADEIISLLLEVENYEAIARAGKYDVLHYSTLSQMIYEFYIPLMLRCSSNWTIKSLDFNTLLEHTSREKQEELIKSRDFMDEEKKALLDKKRKNGNLSTEEWARLSNNPSNKLKETYLKEWNKVWGYPEDAEGTSSNLSKLQQKMADQWEQITNTLYLLSKLNKGNTLSKYGNSIEDLIKSKKKTILFFNMDATSNPVGVSKIGRMIIMDIRQQFAHLREANKKLCFICDEFSSYATNAIADVLEKGRSSGNETIIAAQTVAGIEFIGREFKDRLLGNTDTKIIHRINNAKDAEELAHIFGTSQDIARTYQTDQGEMSNMGSVREVESFLVHPNDIKKCPNYYAYILTLRKQAEKHGRIIKVRPLIYDGEILIDPSGLSETHKSLDCSRIVRQNKMSKLDDEEFQKFRHKLWLASGHKLEEAVPDSFIPTKEDYIESGESISK